MYSTTTKNQTDKRNNYYNSLIDDDDIAIDSKIPIFFIRWIVSQIG